MGQAAILRLPPLVAYHLHEGVHLPLDERLTLDFIQRHSGRNQEIEIFIHQRLFFAQIGVIAADEADVYRAVHQLLQDDLTGAWDEAYIQTVKALDIFAERLREMKSGKRIGDADGQHFLLAFPLGIVLPYFPEEIHHDAGFLGKVYAVFRKRNPLIAAMDDIDTPFGLDVFEPFCDG